MCPDHCPDLSDFYFCCREGILNLPAQGFCFCGIIAVTDENVIADIRSPFPRHLFNHDFQGGFCPSWSTDDFEPAIRINGQKRFDMQCSSDFCGCRVQPAAGNQMLEDIYGKTDADSQTLLFRPGCEFLHGTSLQFPAHRFPGQKSLRSRTVFRVHTDYSAFRIAAGNIIGSHDGTLKCSGHS